MSSSQKNSAKFVAPDACALCGQMQRNHGLRFHKEMSGFMGWVAPSNALRLERMKTNRALGLKNITPHWGQNKPKGD